MLVDGHLFLCWDTEFTPGHFGILAPDVPSMPQSILLQLPFQLHVQRHDKIRDLLRGSEVLSERQSETGLTFVNGEKISVFNILFHLMGKEASNDRKVSVAA